MIKLREDSKTNIFVINFESYKMPGETSSSSMSISTAEITNACNNRIPVLKSTEIKEYLRWRKSIDVWLRITKLDKNEQGACILINALDDVKAKDIAYTIEITDLEKDNGAELLLKLLDDQFKEKEEDKVRKAYNNWKVCEKKRRYNLRRIWFKDDNPFPRTRSGRY